MNFPGRAIEERVVHQHKDCPDHGRAAYSVSMVPNTTQIPHV